MLIFLFFNYFFLFLVFFKSQLVELTQKRKEKVENSKLKCLKVKKIDLECSIYLEEYKI